MPGEYRARITMGSGGGGAARSFQTLDNGQPPSAESLRSLRRLHAAAVCVVTTAFPGGLRGVTATAFTVVSLAPPRVLVCLGQGSDALGWVTAAGNFAVNVLADQQEFLAERFAGRAPLVNARFEGVKHQLTARGNPVLVDGLAWFDCAVESVHTQGDHVVVFGEVLAGGYGDGDEPLLYYDGAYRFLQTS
ncbi:MAG TPA: flavin reductase family protein [Chloroflexota bacterium]|nr:flavin reductase family protein [Chloroflexota bacterium]